MLSSGMKHMVREMVRILRTDLAGRSALLLARSVPEMTAIAKYADSVRFAQDFSRVCYEAEEGPDGLYLYVLSYILEMGEEPSDLWVANISDCTLDRMNYFADRANVTDFVLWPDPEGRYVMAPYDAWKGRWSEEGTQPVASPWRPPEVIHTPCFSAGPLEEPKTPPVRPVSVWEHIRHNIQRTRKERR